MADNTNIEIFNEILASDRMGAFQNWNTPILQAFGDDPTVLWEHIKWNPWVAMAVFEDMEDKDATLFSCLEKRKDGVLSLPRRVMPASESRQDKKIAEFVEETIEQYWGGARTALAQDSDESPFEDFLSEALDAVGDGVAIGEIIFAEAKDRVYISEVKFKPQHLFAFGDTGIANYSTNLMMYPQTGRLRLRQGVMVEGYQADILGAELPEQKFFVFSYRPKKSNRWGMPVKRKCFWHTWLKRAGVKGWLRYIEKGSGTVVARYNDGAALNEQQIAVAAATAIQEESAVAVPKKFIVEVHEMVRNIGAAPKEFVDDYCNAEISRAVVGQTLTGRGSDGGGSRALGEVHERVEDKKIEADAKGLMAVVNKRIVRPLVFMNFGPDAALPTWMLEYEQSEDLTKLAERYGKLRKDVGLPLSKKHVYDSLQMPEPVDEADALGAETAAPDAATKEKPVDGKKSAEFAEKKTLKTGASAYKSNSKTARFRRLRPSMMQFSDD